ncbi:MAG: hypothetical protein IPJ81_07080 [Chitinophagaceae bacterium]|nr:hypothetical protein [Chitinophagaceae bacterium]
MKPKTYILQKDIFFAKAGDEFIETGTNSMSYLHKQTWCQLSVDVIENNPEWFKLKEEEREKIQISSSIYKCGMTGKTIFNYQINLSKCLRDDTVSKIQEAIQKIVNDD